MNRSCRARAILRPLSVLLIAASPLSLPGQLIEEIEDGVRLGAVRSEVQPPLSETVQPLLEALCPGRVVRNSFLLLGCNTAVPPEPGDANWRAPQYVNGILSGHFLGPQSEDVILSGSRDEGHLLRWGGTLLMTRQNGVWRPLWYRSGIITRHCMKVGGEAGKQMLVCESGFQVSGHRQHAVYSLELGEAEPVQELLIATDSYSSVSEKQEQRVEAVSMVAGTATALRVRLHHERRVCGKPWEECSEEDFQPAGHPTELPAGSYELDFVLKGSRLVIAPASEALFRQLFPEHAKYMPEGLISNGEPPQPH